MRRTQRLQWQMICGVLYAEFDEERLLLKRQPKYDIALSIRLVINWQACWMLGSYMQIECCSRNLAERDAGCPVTPSLPSPICGVNDTTLV